MRFSIEDKDAAGLFLGLKWGMKIAIRGLSFAGLISASWDGAEIVGSFARWQVAPDCLGDVH
jgi:hypothetical protein